jgi:SAM-dependent methyltransferase
MIDMQKDSWLIDKYKQLHSGEGEFFYRGIRQASRPDMWSGICFETKLLKLLVRVTAKRKTFSVLDWGCGKANYSEKVHTMFDGRLQCWYLYDPGFVKFETPPSGTFDFIVCADVMEHIEDPEESLLRMNSHLDEKGIALFTICGRPDSRTFDDGLNMHVTLKSFEEWKLLLKTHFGHKKVILIYNNRNFWESWNATV